MQKVGISTGVGGSELRGAGVGKGVGKIREIANKKWRREIDCHRFKYNNRGMHTLEMTKLAKNK